MLLTAFRTPESPPTLCGATEGVTDLLGFGIPLCDFRKPYSRVYRKDVSRKPLSSDSEKELVPSRLAHQSFLSRSRSCPSFSRVAKGNDLFGRNFALRACRFSGVRVKPSRPVCDGCRCFGDFPIGSVFFCILRRLTENSRHFKSPSFRDSAA